MINKNAQHLLLRQPGLHAELLAAAPPSGFTRVSVILNNGRPLHANTRAKRHDERSTAPEVLLQHPTTTWAQVPRSALGRRLPSAQTLNRRISQGYKTVPSVLQGSQLETETREMHLVHDLREVVRPHNHTRWRPSRPLEARRLLGHGVTHNRWTTTTIPVRHAVDTLSNTKFTGSRTRLSGLP